MSVMVWFVLVGIASGWLAGVLVRGGGFGILGDMVAGVLGAVIGGGFFAALDITIDGLPGAILISILGAAMLIITLRLAKRG